LLQLEKGGSNLCRAHRRQISFRAYDMVFDEGLIRLLLYPAIACNCKRFIYNLSHLHLLTFPLTRNHLLFTIMFYTGKKPTF